MIIEISVAVIALAFFVLVIYLIIMILALRKTLRHVDHLIFETKKIVGQVGEVGPNFKYKLEALDPIFQSISNLGKFLDKKTRSLGLDNSCCSQPKQANLDYLASLASSTASEREGQSYELNRCADLLELGSFGIRLWQKLKKRG